MDLQSIATGVLSQLVQERGAAGIAVCSAATGATTATWIPTTAAAEPAYLAYSITKTFTATLLLLLRDNAQLALDDRLARWFPHISGSDRISLRQLLTHTAGIPDYGELRSYHDAVRTSPSVPWSFERFAAETFDKGLRFEPGSGWAYSNPGYMLLRRIAEDVAGASFATLIAERIARPLELRRTFVPTSREELALLAPALSGSLSVDGPPRDVRDHYHPGWVSHGVVASTPTDIARFFDALFCRGLVSAHSLREMTALVPVPGESAGPRWRRPGYGLGLMGDPESPWSRLWGHNGGGPGYRTSAFHAAELGLSVCAMCAGEGEPGAEHLVSAVLDAVR